MISNFIRKSIKTNNIIGKGTVHIVYLHGLFGSGDNWRISNRLLENRANESKYSNLELYSLDLRNHGGSMHSSSMKLDELVDDLGSFLRDSDILKKKYSNNDRLVLIGQSVGGKIGMLYSLKHKSDIDGLVCVDVSPTSYVGIHNHNSKFEAMIAASSIFNNVDTTKSKIEDVLESFNLDKGNRLYLLNNLIENNNNKLLTTTTLDQKFKWRINLKTLYEYQDELLGFPTKDKIIERYNYIGGGSSSSIGGSEVSPIFEKEVLFIGGDESHYLRSPHSDNITTYFPNYNLHFIKGGHFAHTQSPRTFVEHLLTYLNKV